MALKLRDSSGSLRNWVDRRNYWITLYRYPLVLVQSKIATIYCKRRDLSIILRCTTLSVLLYAFFSTRLHLQEIELSKTVQFHYSQHLPTRQMGWKYALNYYMSHLFLWKACPLQLKSICRMENRRARLRINNSSSWIAELFNSCFLYLKWHESEDTKRRQYL